MRKRTCPRINKMLKSETSSEFNKMLKNGTWPYIDVS
jgi:hypothetical protein